MRALITGGYGYLGGRLAKYLAGEGFHVTLGVSKLRSNTCEWLPQANIIEIDWNDSNRLKEVCARQDCVIHTAGMNAPSCADDPAGALIVNGVWSARLAQAALSAGVNKLVYFSTIHVYGAALKGVITEDQPPINLHPYATSHLAGENAFRYTCLSSNTIPVILRLSNMIGPPVHSQVNCWDLFVNNICLEAVKKRTITIKNNANDIRDFLAITELSRAVKGVLFNQRLDKSDAIVNVGSGKVQTLASLAIQVQTLCQELMGYTPQLIAKTQTKTQTTTEDTYTFDCSRLKNLGIEMDTDLSAEITNTLLFCASNIVNRSPLPEHRLNSREN
jgi:UDP-glucose 4-epimerase